MSRLKLFVATITVCLVVSSTVQAQLITDPQLAIGGNGTPGTNTWVAPGGGDPNQFTGGLVFVNNNSGGADTQNPVLLILAVPNGAGAPGSISSVTYVNPALGTTATQMGATTGTGTAGGAPVYGYSGAATLGPLTSGDIYTFMGVDKPFEKSLNFDNMHNFDSGIGINASSFTLYVYELSSSVVLADKGVIAVQFASIPTGTFVGGYSETSQHTFSTPFTVAGLERGTTTVPTAGGQSSVPVPPSALLLGIGGLGLAIFGLNRRRQAVAA
jgi:hypothetical protein